MPIPAENRPPAATDVALAQTLVPSPSEADAVARTLDAPSSADPTAVSPNPGSMEPAESERRGMVPGYELLGELGRGAMGVVYQARQTAANRVVALKMILAGALAGAKERTRFKAEAEAAARLQHPHIVQVFEVGEVQGQQYFSLEYCAGGSLEHKLHGTPLPAQEAAALVEKLARAMHHAHQQGILHRDLKPANVMLDRDGEPKIGDFGLAKKLDEASQTQSGAVVGTPSYMAPEQARGQGKELGPACDVYALGAILYDCLTGRPPFRAATVMDTLMQVIHDEPVPPRQLQSKCPRDLETICLKCLHKEPARRYASASELADDLGRFQRGEPVLARPVGQLERGWRWCRRNRTTAGLLASVALTLLVGAVVSLLLYRDARIQEAATRKEAERAERGESLARQAEQEERIRREQIEYQVQCRTAEQAWRAGNIWAGREALDNTRPAYRGWEYGYLYNLLHRPQQTFLGHTNIVNSVSFSPDGKRLASASDDKTVKVWDAASGQELLNLKGHRHSIYSVSFSPDGKRLASASADSTKVWDAFSGQELLSLNGHKSVSFSPDGKRIASASMGQTVKVWDASSGVELLALKGHTSGITSVSFSPDGKRLAFGIYDSAVKVCDAASGRELLSLKGPAGSITSVSFSPDGSRIAAAAGDSTVKVWDAISGQELLSLKGHTSVSFSPDGKRIASASTDQTVKVWNAFSGQELLSLKGQSSILSVAFSPDGKRLASANWDSTVKVWDASSARELLYLKGHTDFITSMSFSPNGKRLASASYDKTVKVWDAGSARELLTLKGHTLSVRTVSFSPDSKRLASASDDKTVKVWDADSGRELLTLKRLTSSVRSVSFSPDSKRLAAASEDKTVTVWGAASGQELLAFKGHTGSVHSAAFSPDGKRIASASADSTVKVWDASSGQDLLTLEGHTSDVISVSFSPNGERIASASGDCTVRVWDAASGRHLHTLKGHTSYVLSVSFSPDGNRLASASWGSSNPGEVKVWDAASGLELLTFKGPTSLLNSVSFSPDGKRLAASTRNSDKPGEVMVWEAFSGQELLILKGLTSGLFSSAQSTVSFSPDGKRIASGSDDSTVKVWDAASGQELLTLKGFTASVTRVTFSPDSKRLAAADQGGKALVWDLASGNIIPSADDKPSEGSAVSPDGRLFAFRDGSVVRILRRPSGEERSLLRQMSLPDPSWHREQARDSEAKQDWFGAAFHQGRLLALEPWDLSAHISRAHALAAMGRANEASLQYLQALSWSPRGSLWPAVPEASKAAHAAAEADDWARAASLFRLSAHQPSAGLADWTDLLLAQRAARQSDACRASCGELLGRFENIKDNNLLWQTFYACRDVPLATPDALRLVKIAERLAAPAPRLDFLGSALYRAERHDEAARTLEEAIRKQGGGGYSDTWLLLAMARQKLGQSGEARRWFAKFEDWLKTQPVKTWQDKLRLQLLHEEAKVLILTMPPAPQDD